MVWKGIKLAIHDVSMESDNLGDEIIMHFSNKVINELFPRRKEYRIPTHRFLDSKELKWINKSDIQIVCGTNIICPDIEKYRQWKIREEDYPFYNSILMSVGMNSYGEMTDKSVDYLKGLLISDVPISVRDEYTKETLNKNGIVNVINTQCVTMWELTDEFVSDIPRYKADRVVFTLTYHRRNNKSDLELIEMLINNYDKIYFWPQGDKDLDYYNKLTEGIDAQVTILERSLRAYSDLLSEGNIDYIGTRLHGGIFALNSRVRTFIIKVDNRATEISKDTNLPCYERSEIKSRLQDDINGEYKASLNINWDSIEEWKRIIKDYCNNK